MLNMGLIILELQKSNGSTPKEKQVLEQFHTAMYKEYVSEWGYFPSDQV